MEIIKLKDYTVLDQKFLDRCRKGVEKLNGFAKEYKTLEGEGSLEKLETLKREHSSYVAYFITFYSQIAAYKENFEHLSNERKNIKAECIARLMHAGEKITAAEKLVYADKDYKQSVAELQDIKKFFIFVEEIFEYHKNTLSRNIYQSVSLEKDNQNKNQ